MKPKIGIMGSAADALPTSRKGPLVEKATALARALASRQAFLLSGATTGVVYVIGKGAREAGTFHVGISPASDSREHVKKYKLPLDACDLIVYTGFGLKGRNVVLVRSCDVVLFVAGSMGTLNEFTIAHDEGKVIGCLTGTGGVADETDYLLEKFTKDAGARIFRDDNPESLLNACLTCFEESSRTPSPEA